MGSSFEQTRCYPCRVYLVRQVMLFHLFGCGDCSYLVIHKELSTGNTAQRVFHLYVWMMALCCISWVCRPLFLEPILNLVHESTVQQCQESTFFAFQLTRLYNSSNL
ncbi:hypothetical protein IW262DRAFT_268239 [Armillaria fumosa]|nr:hypothetical protein IW262DRAFT_268239 [Armillaria fumosa]